jgi:hypothetical protein
MSLRGGARGMRGGFRGFGSRGRGGERGRGGFRGGGRGGFRGGRGGFNGAPSKYDPAAVVEGSAPAQHPPQPRIFPLTLQTLSPGEQKVQDRLFPDPSSLTSWVRSAPGGMLKAFATNVEPEAIISSSMYHRLDGNRVYGIHYLQRNEQGELLTPIVDPVPMPREQPVKEMSFEEVEEEHEQDDQALQNGPDADSTVEHAPL